MASSASTFRRIGLFVRADLSTKRELMRGIAAEARTRGNWELLLLAPVNRHVAFNVPPVMDGLIAWLDEPDEAKTLLVRRPPAVLLGGREPEGDVPVARLRFDSVAMGRRIAEALLGKGLRNFAAYCQRLDYAYGGERLRGFAERLGEAGLPAPSCYDGEVMSREPSRWLDELETLGTWLRGLPRPCGLLCDTDQAGADLLRACQHHGVRVPDEIAVIAVGDDDLLCQLSHPALSSLNLRPRDAARLAVELLEQRMRHPRRRPSEHVLADFPIMERASSDLVAVDDAAVAAALRLIRERACSGLGVEELARATRLSRRMLEMRFKAATGNTLHGEITRVRMARAQELLAESDLRVAEIAERCGYGEPQRLCEAFAREGLASPAAWRAARRGGMV